MATNEKCKILFKVLNQQSDLQYSFLARAFVKDQDQYPNKRSSEAGATCGPCYTEVDSKNHKLKNS